MQMFCFTGAGILGPSLLGVGVFSGLNESSCDIEILDLIVQIHSVLLPAEFEISDNEQVQTLQTKSD